MGKLGSSVLRKKPHASKIGDDMFKEVFGTEDQLTFTEVKEPFTKLKEKVIPSQQELDKLQKQKDEQEQKFITYLKSDQYVKDKEEKAKQYDKERGTFTSVKGSKSEEKEE
jgi:uncharacterized membrane-anchored protein YjiN (DUF445 family)